MGKAEIVFEKLAAGFKEKALAVIKDLWSATKELPQTAGKVRQDTAKLNKARTYYSQRNAHPGGMNIPKKESKKLKEQWERNKPRWEKKIENLSNKRMENLKRGLKGLALPGAVGTAGIGTGALLFGSSPNSERLNQYRD